MRVAAPRPTRALPLIVRNSKMPRVFRTVSPHPSVKGTLSARGGTVREEIVDACLAEIQQLWQSSSEEARPESVWIALHRPVARGTEDPETPVLRAWLLDRTGLNKRQASDYVRFIGIHTGRGWASGTAVPAAAGVFNNRPGRMHTIGLASFAAVEESVSVYMQYIFGGTTGRGSLYEFSETGGCLKCTQNIWLS